MGGQFVIGSLELRLCFSDERFALPVKVDPSRAVEIDEATRLVRRLEKRYYLHERERVGSGKEDSRWQRKQTKGHVHL